MSLSDAQVQALHALSVVDAARALTAELAVLGAGAARDLTGEGVTKALDALVAQVNRLAVFEARASARGTVEPLTEAHLSALISGVRHAHIPSAAEREVRAGTERFTLDSSPPDAPDATATAPTTTNEPFTF